MKDAAESSTKAFRNLAFSTKAFRLLFSTFSCGSLLHFLTTRDYTHVVTHQPGRSCVMKQYQLPAAHELDKIVPLRVAAQLSGLSKDTWKRSYPQKLIKLSPRRIGVRLRDPLLISSNSD